MPYRVVAMTAAAALTSTRAAETCATSEDPGAVAGSQSRSGD